MPDPTALRLAQARAIIAAGKAREAREQARLSLAEVARAIGVAPSTVQRWEVDRVLPRSAAALAWLELLEQVSDVLKDLL